MAMQNDEVYLGPFQRNQCDKIAGVIRNHLDEFKDSQVRNNLDTALKPDHWVTRDRILGQGGAQVGGATTSQR